MNTVELQAAVDAMKADAHEASNQLADLANRFDALQASIEAIARTLNTIKIDPPSILVDSPVGNVAFDHAALQAAIDAAAMFPLRADGLKAVVHAARGRYMVDAVRSLVLRPHVRLEMAPDTVLEAVSNSAKRYNVLRAESDSQISGGIVIGERLTHVYDDPDSTDEWGYVLMVSGDRVKVENTILREGTGDGLGVTGAQSEFRNVRCLYNRRNGLSAFAAKDAVFIECEFSDTGDYKHDLAPRLGPCAGVDIEPDGNLTGEAPNVCDGLVFQRCVARRNRSAGFKSYTNLAAEVDAEIRNIHFDACISEYNGGDGMWLGYIKGVSVTRCLIQHNKGYGLHLLNGATTIPGVPIDGNTFFDNLTRLNTLDRTPDDLDREGLVAANNRDLKVEPTAGACAIGANDFL